MLAHMLYAKHMKRTWSAMILSWPEPWADPADFANGLVPASRIGRRWRSSSAALVLRLGLFWLRRNCGGGGGVGQSSALFQRAFAAFLATADRCCSVSA